MHLRPHCTLGSESLLLSKDLSRYNYLSSPETMHFLVFGASGRTGQHVVSELLSQGHIATALVRSTGSPSPLPGLTVVTGSLLSESDVQRTLSAEPSLRPSAAIITLNTVSKSDSPFVSQISPPRFLADSCANICEILDCADIHHVVVMSTAGVGDSWTNLPWLSKAF
jgi:nucleoside-diphosphate-sugar epimerase